VTGVQTCALPISNNSVARYIAGHDDGPSDVALVAGIMWGSKSGVQFSLSLIALKALPVLILGGFTSVPGAIIGGMIIGVGEKVAEVYLGPFVGGAIENWFAYMLALVFLLFRPQGLFGERIIERV
jgi:branched-chain amino acid transport system permease protein